MYPGLQKADYGFVLDVPLKSKARPRFARGHAYMPKDYREWIKLCRSCIKTQMELQNMPTISHASHLSLLFSGYARHDLDNLLGAVLDAGLPCGNWSGAWADDRVSVFPSICVNFVKSSNSSIEIYIWL